MDIIDGYHITTTRYERELVAFTNIIDAIVVCPKHAEMLDEYDSELLSVTESKYSQQWLLSCSILLREPYVTFYESNWCSNY